MSELITQIKLSTPDYTLLSQGSERQDTATVTMPYSKDGWVGESKTIYNNEKVVEATLKSHKVINGIVTAETATVVNTETFDGVTNKLTNVTEIYCLNIKKEIIEMSNYDPVYDKVKPINQIVTDQIFGPQGTINYSTVATLSYKPVSKKFVLTELVITSEYLDIGPGYKTQIAGKFDSVGNIIFYADSILDYNDTLLGKIELEREFNSNNDVVRSIKYIYNASNELMKKIEVCNYYDSQSNMTSSIKATRDANGKLIDRVKVLQEFNTNGVIIKKEIVEEVMYSNGATDTETTYKYYNGRFDDKNSFTSRVEKYFTTSNELIDTLETRQRFESSTSNKVAVTTNKVFNADGKLYYHDQQKQGSEPEVLLYKKDLVPTNANLRSNHISKSCYPLENNNQLIDSINSFPTREQAAGSVATVIDSYSNPGPRSLVGVANFASKAPALF
ncbi:hypothetical protein [Yersinia enterocolitica]|uniref:hypothetical protein n=1 Tax=Yersinia enterocolitica TaxID=630 RepID=UPI00338D4F9A